MLLTIARPRPTPAWLRVSFRRALNPEVLSTRFSLVLVVWVSVDAVADAFRGRLGSAYGTLAPGVDSAAIVERHRPVVSAPPPV
jgi:hypothetical protein